MKANILCLYAANAILLTCASSVQAQIYVNGEAGVSLPQHLGIRSEGVEETATFNPGVRGASASVTISRRVLPPNCKPLKSGTQ